MTTLWGVARGRLCAAVMGVRLPLGLGAGGCSAARAVCHAAVPLSRGGGGTCLRVRGPCARAALGLSAAVSESVWQDLGPSGSLSIGVALSWLGRL